MENKITKSLVIIGGGPAGLSAANAAWEAGCRSICIVERDRELGGILNQCIHNGFGLHTFKEELTGPEYAARFEERAKALHIPYKLGAMVLSISPEKVVTAVSREDGLFTVEAGAVILAMGCRERSRGALNIPGFRPAGVFSAGTAQRLVNMEGYMPGREVVILGSGDIGLIMARRMTLEGAKVLACVELCPYSNGLNRNIVQCLNDYNIPLYLSHTITDIKGRERVEQVRVRVFDERDRRAADLGEVKRADVRRHTDGDAHVGRDEDVREGRRQQRALGSATPLVGAPANNRAGCGIANGDNQIVAGNGVGRQGAKDSISIGQRGTNRRNLED